MPTIDEARRFVADSGISWWQRFELVPGFWTPGNDHISILIADSELPSDLTGMSVLDVGAANGAVSFELERRGAARVVGVDINSGTNFGFEQTRDFLGSGARFIRASVYELPALIDETFDIVVFFGVLYHLRHPLLGLDNLRRLSRPDGTVLIETAVADHQVMGVADRPVALFYPERELNNDGSNWFAPTIACLAAWCASSGFVVEILARRPELLPSRCLVRARPLPGPAAYESISYERPLRVVAD